MTVLCGTDFSEYAGEAARAACAIASRHGEAVQLVHVRDDLGFGPVKGEAETLAGLRERLAELATSLSHEFGVEVKPILQLGAPEDVLVSAAVEAEASLIVVSSLGSKKQGRWLLGSVAERVAQSSPIPVLVVRRAEGLVEWSSGKRPLRALVGVDLTSASREPLTWVTGQRMVGTCDVVACQIARPPEEHERLGIRGPIPMDVLRPEVEAMLLRDLKAFVGELGGDGLTSCHVSPGYGRIDAHLSLIGEERNADLVVVGTHWRAAAARFWQGSVSRGVLHNSTANVVCVPPRERTRKDIPQFHEVLVPTDLSPLANRAVAVAYGMVAPAGVVYLVHVVEHPDAANDADVAARLRHLVPAGAVGRGITTECVVAHGREPSLAIWHAAEQRNVDAICMSTHGRTGALKVLLGSQAQDVLRRAHKPVLLIPPERG